NLYVGRLRTQGVNERLEHRNSIFGTESLVAECCEGQPVRDTICQVELAIGVKAFVLRVGQPRASGLQHAGKLFSRRSLNLEFLNLYEIVELLFAHGWRCFSEPKIKIF